MKGERGERWREWERPVWNFLEKYYPANRNWVKVNLDVLIGLRGRKGFNSDADIVEDSLKVTRGFAQHHGINLEFSRGFDVTHIPSRLAAVRVFEKDTPPLYRKLLLDDMVKTYILAEASSVPIALEHYALTDKAQEHLDKLNKLMELHKALRAGN